MLTLKAWADATFTPDWQRRMRRELAAQRLDRMRWKRLAKGMNQEQTSDGGADQESDGR